MEKWLAESEMQAEHVDSTQLWQPGPTAPSRAQSKNKAIKIRCGIKLYEYGE